MESLLGVFYLFMNWLSVYLEMKIVCLQKESDNETRLTMKESRREYTLEECESVYFFLQRLSSLASGQMKETVVSVMMESILSCIGL